MLRRFCEDKRHFFYVADLGTEASTLAELARRYGEMFHNDPESTHFASWDQALKAWRARLAKNVSSSSSTGSPICWRPALPCRPSSSAYGMNSCNAPV